MYNKITWVSLSHNMTESRSKNPVADFARHIRMLTANRCRHASIRQHRISGVLKRQQGCLAVEPPGIAGQ
jgi:hypothetical protein